MSIKDRGFASMPRERRLKIARMGGRAAQASGRAYQWTSEAASLAGRKGAARRALKRLQEERERAVAREAREVGA